MIYEVLRKKGNPEYLVLMIHSWLADRVLLVSDLRDPKLVT